MAEAATAAGIGVLSSQTVAGGTTDIGLLLEQLQSLHPERIVTLLGSSSGTFFHAYEQGGGRIPLAGRIDFAAALANLSPSFLAAGGLDQAVGISVFTPSAPIPAVSRFVASYKAKYGLAPTQRSVFAFEATELVVDAIRRVGSMDPSAIQQALKSTRMPSMLGGTFTMDAHNHAHTMMQIVGIRNGKVTVLDQLGQ